MSTPELIVWLFLALLGLVGSWLCSGMETGTYTLNRIRLMVRSDAPASAGRDTAARLLRREVDNPERLLGTILIGNNIFAYLAAASITVMLAARGYGDTQIMFINILILTPLILIFCEALPKELFRVEADRLSYFFAPVITGLRLIFTIVPVLPLVVWFARTAARILHIQGEIGLAVSARERVAMLLKESVSDGALSQAQAQLVDRAIAFHGLQLGDEMVPWARAAAIRSDWTRQQVLDLMARRPFSRYPVVEQVRPRRAERAEGESTAVGSGPGKAAGLGASAGGGTLRVIGVVRLADVYLRPEASIRDLLIEPVRLTPHTPLREAILRVRENPSGLIVVEQNGRPVGVATVKDLAEPLTGVLEA